MTITERYETMDPSLTDLVRHWHHTLSVSIQYITKILLTCAIKKQVFLDDEQVHWAIFKKKLIRNRFNLSIKLDYTGSTDRYVMKVQRKTIDRWASCSQQAWSNLKKIGTILQTLFVLFCISLRSEWRFTILTPRGSFDISTFDRSAGFHARLNWQDLTVSHVIGQYK